MPEQTFRSPNFFDREIDQSAPAEQGPVGVPAGVIGTSNRGPAFVPVTVGNFDQFISIFGNLDPKRFGPYAANAFLANRSSLTFLRMLGAGANSTSADILRTQGSGRVVSASFKLDGNPNVNGPALDATHERYTGCTQFLVARHVVQANEAYGTPMFTDNNSISTSGIACLVRGVVLLASGARMMVASSSLSLNSTNINTLGDSAGDNSSEQGVLFKLIISSSLGSAYYSDDGVAGMHVFTASMDPSNVNYFAKVLNTDPDKFVSAQHLLYSDFAVDAELAKSTVVGVLSGSTLSSKNSGESGLIYRKAFGAFDTRFKTPVTPFFISQPFGTVEYDLFAIEALDDGAYANNLFKISITNIKASLDAANPFGTFTVQIRDWNDNDVAPMVLEQFNGCNLNPNSDHYVAKIIGDRKVSYNFDATDPNERRIITAGKYSNVSGLVRVVMSNAVDTGNVPENSLPFGFRGHALLKTNDTLTDAPQLNGTVGRITGSLSGSTSAMSLSGSIVPPVPFRTKVTKGARPATTWHGTPGVTELATSLYYWGVKFDRNDIVLDPNLQTEQNPLLKSYTQFQGIKELDVLVTGSGADTFNNNKFTLARVALSNLYATDVASVLTASVDTHMREAAYIRNARIDSTIYTVPDIQNPIGTGTTYNRITFATLLAKATPSQFNRFSPYMKFTSFMQGGYDGVNFLDPDARRMNDKASSFDAGGGAESTYVSPGMLTNMNGTGQINATVGSYVAAINIMTNPLAVNHNLLVLPGIRDPFVTDYAAASAKAYGLAFYVMDIEKFDENGARLFDDSTTRPDVDKTAAGLDTRSIDNNYVGAYFPDVFIDDTTNKRRLKVPASIAAMGALGFNDRVGYPWFAPAGFNRAALDFVTNVEVRLNSADRDRLYESRINPIATFPRQGFVIFGQKTLQIASSALDRVNVRRLLLEVKRIIVDIAMKIEFEQNTPEVWNKFVSQAVLQLGLIQAQAGIEAFQVVMNETNNTESDKEHNKVNGRIVIVPTRVIEFIAIDFIITNSGVTFV